MTAPIIPGIDDARAREMLCNLATHRDWNVVKLKNRLEHEQPAIIEMNALIRARLAKWVCNNGSINLEYLTYRITPAGRALWERIKNDDR